MASTLSAVEILPTSTHKYSIIWLHGLGADGHDFESLAPSLNLIDASSIHFIFPNAPVSPLTINGGIEMRSWYDILDMELERKVDISGIYQSAIFIEQFIQQEIDKGIPSENILLAGFSQGGLVALHTGLRCNYKLAGIIALSTYLPTVEQLKTERAENNQTTPIFFGHGIIDSIVAVEMGKRAFDDLKTMGYDVRWHDYLMEHSVCVEEVEHISAFIDSVFK